MNPQSNEQTGLNLPAPMVEQAPAAMTPEATAPVAEALRAEPQPAVENGQAAPTIPLPVLPQSAVPVTVPVATPTTVNDASLVADDGDLIEKEWVAKAKKIVEANREDPYEQSKQLTVVKVDYLQKRYNKTVKLAE